MSSQDFSKPASFPVQSPRKLIEVALPLDAINEACAREKSIRHGHPSTLHLWWARRPLAAARAVLFAQLVNDPSWKWEREHPGEIAPNNQKASWAAKRNQLFEIIKDLVKWENTTNEEVLERARAEIRRSWQEVCDANKDHPQAKELFDPEKLPAFHDPFAGGGSIPLEAQRLGLESYASDLNPVAVLINKAMIEIPPKFAGRPPVGKAKAKEGKKKKKKEDHPDLEFPSSWQGASGLAQDVQYYGSWMKEQAQKRIGHLYPEIEITPEMTQERKDLKPIQGQKLTVIAWIWARTVASPNPAFSHVHVPLASTFVLSSKAGKEAYIQPIIEGDKYHFTVKIGKPPKKAEEGTKISRGSFKCLFSETPMSYAYIDEEANANRINSKMLAIVADGPKGRVYLSPTEAMEEIACSAKPSWKPESPCRGTFASNAQGRIYGFKVFGDYFTPRQLVALTTFSDLVGESRERVRQDALDAGMPDDGKGLEAGGTGATAYSEAVSVYLAFAMTRMADWGNSLCRWESKAHVPQQLFGRQAIPMIWDFCETNVLSESTGSYIASIMNIVSSFKKNTSENILIGIARQADAQNQTISNGKWISTDPPYYDNIGYADLSDFFYVWLRRCIRTIYPSLFASIAVPKTEELIASPYRHGGKEKAEAYFLEGMTLAIRNLAKQSHSEGILTLYYAFKQSESDSNSNITSTGWVTFLGALLQAGFQLTGTWPLRTENASRMIGQNTNALASSIVLVCRKRPANAPIQSRREFVRELNRVLPEAMDNMTRGAENEHSPVAPVDLSQAIIGPGMAVFSRYSAVLEADGTPMTVRTALQLINRFLAEDDFDAQTQFCLSWLEQYGWNEGPFGTADVLARSKSTSVEAMKETQILRSGGGKVRLLAWTEYTTENKKNQSSAIWKALHQLIFAFKKGGDQACGELLSSFESQIEAIRQLAYRLYTLCERMSLAEEARSYNELITSWNGIEAALAQTIKPVARQMELFEK